MIIVITANLNTMMMIIIITIVLIVIALIIICTIMIIIIIMIIIMTIMVAQVLSNMNVAELVDFVKVGRTNTMCVVLMKITTLKMTMMPKWLSNVDGQSDRCK